MRAAVTHFSRATLAATLTLAFLPFASAGAQHKSIFDIIPWTEGPTTGRLGLVAMLDVPEYCHFGDGKGARTFLEATQNTPGGNEVGVLLCSAAGADSSLWFVVFSFDESGYVKDDEKATLNADKILKGLRDGQEEANKERKSRGWDEFILTGWDRAPYYDSLTNNLTWSLRLRSSEDPDESVNHSVRLLGRKGVMHADLVADPADMPRAVPAFDSILTTYEFVTGQRYAEWKSGDKVASYGLTALVAGGAGLAAAKLGFFGKIWKWILGVLLALKKAIIVVVVAIAALFKRVFGKKTAETAGTAATPGSGPPRTSTSTPAKAPAGAYKPVQPPAAVAAPSAAPGRSPTDPPK
jgi:uncharacterized membrane-anchored protein